MDDGKVVDPTTRGSGWLMGQRRGARSTLITDSNCAQVHRLIPAHVLGLVVGITLAGCASKPTVTFASTVRELNAAGIDVIFPEFSSNGDLLNAYQLIDRIDALGERTSAIDRVVIVALGWNYSREQMKHEYISFLGDLRTSLADSSQQESPSSDASLSRTLLVCICWDSDFGPVTAFLDGFVPGNTLPAVFGFLPDSALFPLSYWKKAMVADRIGQRGLTQLLSYLNDQRIFSGGIPPTYIIAHSFGVRLALPLLRFTAGRLEGTRYNPELNLRGVLLIQGAVPAVSLIEAYGVGVDVTYPLVLTFSRYDHANGWLHPVANTVLNTTSSFVSEELYSGLRELGGEVAERDAIVDPSGEETIAIIDGVVTPVGLLADAILNLILWLPWEHVRQLVIHPVDYLTGTMSQLPVVEVAAQELLESPGGTAGDECRGLLDLGPGAVAVGALPSHILGYPVVHMIPRGWRWQAGGQGGDRLAEVVRSPGMHYINCSEVIRHGALLGLIGRVDLSTWYGDYLVGWTDPVGSHGDYRQPEIYELIEAILAQ